MASSLMRTGIDCVGTSIRTGTVSDLPLRFVVALQDTLSAQAARMVTPMRKERGVDIATRLALPRDCFNFLGRLVVRAGRRWRRSSRQCPDPLYTFLLVSTKDSMRC